MRIVLQRVKKTTLAADGQPFDQMEQGILAMVGIKPGDDATAVMKYMLDKLIHLRIFEDEQGKLNLSVTDKGYSIFLVSNFTLSHNSSTLSQKTTLAFSFIFKLETNRCELNAYIFYPPHILLMNRCKNKKNKKFFYFF